MGNPDCRVDGANRARSRCWSKSALVLAILAALVAPACGPKTGSPPPASAPQPPVSASEAPTAESTASASDPAAHMEANFLRAERARDALMQGNLADAKDEARQLRDRDQSAAFQGPLRHYLEQMRQYADEVVLAADLTQASLAVGRLGVTCGNCHHYAKAGPDASPVTALPWQDPPEPVTNRMLRHDIGVLQMWQGLTSPSDEAWRNGTISLTRAPLEPPREGGEDVSAEAHAAMERIRELARAARMAKTHNERGEVYGALIAECAHCHLAPQ